VCAVRQQGSSADLITPIVPLLQHIAQVFRCCPVMWSLRPPRRVLSVLTLARSNVGDSRARWKVATVVSAAVKLAATGLNSMVR